MVELAVVAADILHTPCDILLLKHADGFYGVDKIVSDRLNFVAGVPEGENAFLVGQNIEARKVLYIGVGPLGDFRYPQIRQFGRKALELVARGSGTTRVICTPLHGPGYGLDERESFLSLVGGFLDGIEDGLIPEGLERIEIVEISQHRAKRLSGILSEALIQHENTSNTKKSSLEKGIRLSAVAHNSLSSYGVQSEKKTTLFVAMPFAVEHSDVWEISIREACQKADLVCERIDQQAFTGDILSEIKSRLQSGSGVLALLDDANPNVFLEIGFAWGAGKPTVLMAKKGAPLPFDIRGQKCIQYTSIAELRTLLTNELVLLKGRGVFERK